MRQEKPVRNFPAKCLLVGKADSLKLKLFCRKIFVSAKPVSGRSLRSRRKFPIWERERERKTLDLDYSGSSKSLIWTGQNEDMDKGWRHAKRVPKPPSYCPWGCGSSVMPPARAVPVHSLEQGIQVITHAVLGWVFLSLILPRKALVSSQNIMGAFLKCRRFSQNRKTVYCPAIIRCKVPSYY